MAVRYALVQPVVTGIICVNLIKKEIANPSREGLVGIVTLTQ